MAFRWKPQTELNRDCIARMRQHFLRPSESPPVAGYNMPIPDYHLSLTEAESNQLADEVLLHHFVFDMTINIMAFGRFKEWDSWILHLLPELVLRSWGIAHQRYQVVFLETTITLLMNLYWNGIEHPYPEFSEDILTAVGAGLMAPNFWEDSNLSEDIDISSISASLFFCLKFLPADEITVWIKSLINIPGKHWKRLFTQWRRSFVPFYKTACASDRHFKVREQLEKLHLNWADSYCLIYCESLFDFIPRANIELFLSELKNYGL